MSEAAEIYDLHGYERDGYRRESDITRLSKAETPRYFQNMSAAARYEVLFRSLEDLQGLWLQEDDWQEGTTTHKFPSVSLDVADIEPQRIPYFGMALKTDSQELPVLISRRVYTDYISERFDNESLGGVDTGQAKYDEGSFKIRREWCLSDERLKRREIKAVYNALNIMYYSVEDYLRFLRGPHGAKDRVNKRNGVALEESDIIMGAFNTLFR